jgi:hypothetical protein
LPKQKEAQFSANGRHSDFDEELSPVYEDKLALENISSSFRRDMDTDIHWLALQQDDHGVQLY